MAHRTVVFANASTQSRNRWSAARRGVERLYAGQVVQFELERRARGGGVDRAAVLEQLELVYAEWEPILTKHKYGEPSVDEFFELFGPYMHSAPMHLDDLTGEDVEKGISRCGLKFKDAVRKYAKTKRTSDRARGLPD